MLSKLAETAGDFRRVLIWGLVAGCLSPAVHAQSSKPVIAAVTNAATYARGPVAPGEMVVIFGSAMGPSPLVTLQLDQSGRLTRDRKSVV